MLEVLSSPAGKVNFTTADGVMPYVHKYATPICRLKYYDTVYNTNFAGIDATWQLENSSGDYETVYEGKVPNIKFYSGEGVPPELLNYKAGQNWRIIYNFTFVAPITAKYYFYFAGEGRVLSYPPVFGVGSSQINAQDFAGKSYLHLDKDETESIIIYYYYGEKSLDSGFIYFWQTDSASYTPEKVVMGGEVIGGTVDNYYLDNFSKISYKESEESISQLTFEVPFISSSDSYNSKGYFYDEAADAYISKENSTNHLKKYRKIEYSEGFKNETDDELITKFTGQIRDIKINYNKDGQDSLKITCNDYSIFTKDAINVMSPTPIDYWQAGYTKKELGRVNGETKPRTFDGWEIHKAFQVILTNCGIDPSSFYKRKEFKSYESISTTAGFLIEPLNLYTVDTAEIPYLPINVNYGIPPVGEVEKQKEDDKYAYSISTGEYYKDAIDKMMKTWGYKWGFNEQGYPYLKGINVPNNFINDRDFNITGTWTNELDVNSFKATYLQTEQSEAIASVDAVGKKFELLVGCGPLCGSSLATEQTFNVILRHGTDEIVDTNYNAFTEIDHGYYNGIDKTTSINKSVLTLANGLDYDSYRIVVRSLSTDYKTRIEGVLTYDEEYDVPLTTFYANDEINNASITELSVQSNINDQRNECIVLGRRTGTIIRVNSDGEETSLNKNNPTYTYVQSNTRDLNSIHISTARNYVGRLRPTIIVDPSIISENQADFISYNVVQEYNTPKKQTTFGLLGHPLLKVGDCVRIIEDYKDGVGSSDYYWITEVSNSFDKNYLTKIQTTPVKPVNSYWSRPIVDVEGEYDGNYIWNLKISNNGFVGNLNSNLLKEEETHGDIFIRKNYLEPTNDRITNTALSYMVPKSGYCRIGTEVIYYASADWTGDDEILRLHQLKRNAESEDSGDPHWGPNFINYTSGDQVVVGHLPYSNIAYAPIIEFDLLADSDVEVNIKNYSEQVDHRVKKVGESLVDSLTNTDKNILGDNHRFLTQGHYSFSWGGFDRSGEYNNNVKDALERTMLNSQFFARENYSTKYFDPEATMIGVGNGKYRLHVHQEDSDFLTYDDSYGMFYAEIGVNSRTNAGMSSLYNSKSSDKYKYDTSLSKEKGTIKQILITPGILDLKFSTSGMSYCHDITKQKEIQNPSFPNETFYSYERTNREVGFLAASEYTQATNYPSVDIAGFDTSIPVFIRNNVNKNEFGVAQGLKFTIKDYQSSKDNYIIKKYLPTMNFKFVQLGWYRPPPGSGGKMAAQFFAPEIHSGVFGEESESDLILPDNEYYINLKQWTRKKKISFIPDQWIKAFIENVSSHHPDATMGVTNYLLFDDNIVDFSGRKPNQVRYFSQNIPVFGPGSQCPGAYVGRLPGDTDVDAPGWELYNILKEYDSPYDWVDNQYLPYHFAHRGDLTASSAETNRGFYEFVFSKGEDLYWRLAIDDPFSNSITPHLYVTMHYHKNINNEIQAHKDATLFRNNYITWLDEDYVREVVFFDNSSWQGGNIQRNVYRLYKESYPGVYVPNLWFQYKRSDF